MSDGKVVLDAEVNSKGVDKGLGETSEKVKTSFKKMDNSFNSVGKSIISLGTAVKVALGAALVSGVKNLTTAGIKYNAEMEKYQTALTTVLGSAKEAQKVMSQIQKDALSTPFDVSSLVQANQFLISAGESAGDSRKTILALGNAVSATGGGNDELQRMAQNLQQVRNNGKATALDIKQFGYAGINIYQLLADYTGKSVKEVQNMEVSYDLLTKALQHASEEGGRYFNAMGKQAETLNGVFSNFKESIQVFAGTLTRGLGESLKGAMKNVTGVMNKLSDAFEKGGFGNMAKVGIDMVNQMLVGITQNAPKITQKASEIIQQLIKGINANGPKLIQNGINAVSGFVTGIAQQLPTLVPMALNMILTLAESFVSNIPKLWDAGLKIIEGLATGIINSIPMLIQKVPLIINTFAANFNTNLVKFLALGAKIIGQLALGLIKSIPLIIQNADQILLAIINVFSLAKMFKLGKGLIQSIGKGLKSLGGWLASTLKSLGNKAWTSFKNINWITAGKSALKSIINGCKNLGSTLWSTMKSLAKKAFDKFKEVDWIQLGKDILNGIIKGIGSMASGLFTKLKNLAKDALGVAKDEIDSHSPSRKFRDEVGMPIVQGIMVGIDRLKKNLNNDIGSLLSIPKEIYTDVDAFSNLPNVSGLGYMSEKASSLYQISNNTNIDYTLLAGMIVNAFTSSNISVEINKRKIGRVIGG